MGGVAHAADAPAVATAAPAAEQEQSRVMSPRTRDVIDRMYGLSVECAPGAEGLSDNLVTSLQTLRESLAAREGMDTDEISAANVILGMIAGMCRIVEDRQELFDQVLAENEEYNKAVAAVMDRLAALAKGPQAQEDEVTEHGDHPA